MRITQRLILAILMTPRRPFARPLAVTVASPRIRKFVLAIFLCFAIAPIPLLASDPEVSVMTRNIYLGGDIGKPLAAKTPAEFFTAVAAVFAEVQATNFPERVEKLAEEIERTKPTLVGLQEVAIWRTQFPADFSPIPNATKVEYDFLQLLQDELARRGLAYSPVVVGTRADIEAPGITPLGFKDFRLTMRDVILVQASAELEISNAAENDFVINAVIPTLAGPIVFTRGWASVDVSKGGQSVRFVNTHLEAVAESIRMAQAAELLTGPANTSLPVILVGDFNSVPGSPPYNQLAGAGFLDAGSEEDEEGFTCCHASDLRNEKSTLSVRIDQVHFRGILRSHDVRLIGHRRRDRTASGLWPSDHGGIIVKLILGQIMDPN